MDYILWRSFVTETKILLHSMSLTVQIGNNVTFDCAGQDNASGPVVYQWSLFGSNLASIYNKRVV